VKNKKALVIGGSLGGLFAGLLLRRIGWDVVICERSGTELGARGAGIVTHDVLHDILALAVDSRTDIGVRVSGRTVFASNGSVICKNEMPQIVASWDQVWKRLRSAAEGIYQHSTELKSLQQDPSGIEAIFLDGTRHRADILIAADGIQSTVRRMLMPEVKPQYAGYIAWRGLVNGADLSAKARDQLFGKFSFCLPPSEQMLGYPVDGGPNGQMRYNYVWYRPADSEHILPQLLTDLDGKVRIGGIPPDQIHPKTLIKMRNAATLLLAPAFTEAVLKTRQPLLQPIVDLEVPSMRIGDRVVLLGDSAFVARPHVGMGVTKAAEDAYALMKALQATADINAALEVYSRTRVENGQRILRRARQLGAYMQAQQLSEDEKLQASIYRNPAAVMTETATRIGMENW
jgi:2-polyprenyl-6-methoxyphenol hydroxylase-like FAD-dependent oxidoreductase